MTVARFEKVSFEEFLADVRKVGLATTFTASQIREMWANIKLPTRSTSGSAGYDFVCPFYIAVQPEGNIIPTGIRCKIDNGYVLMLFPRSSLGFKYGAALNNTVGIIDQDYYNADNEGHIMAKIKSDSALYLKPGDKFVQGVFVQYGTAEEKEVTTERTGGMGSTGR